MRYLPGLGVYVTGFTPGSVSAREHLAQLLAEQAHQRAAGPVRRRQGELSEADATRILRRVGGLQQQLADNIRRADWIAKRRAIDPRELRAAAFHEGGHATVARALGLSVACCTLEPAQCKLASWGGSPHDWLTVGLAGALAEARFVGNDSPQIDGADLEIVDQALDRLSRDERNRQQLWEHAAGKAHSLLTRHWHQVERVAQALVARGALSGVEVRKLFGGAHV
jgi:hypothetical protein